MTTETPESRWRSAVSESNGPARLPSPLSMRGRHCVFDIYLVVLSVVLVGYALLGRSFAYIGVGGVYVAELVVVLAIVALALCAPWRRLAGQPALWLLVALVVWCVIRTLPYLSTHGYDALRDAALVGYSVVGLATAAAIFDHRVRLWRLVRGFARLGPWLLVGSIPLLMISVTYEADLPRVFGGQPLVRLKPGDTATLVAGITALWLACVARWRVWVVLLIPLAFLLPAMLNRGGMLAFLVAVMVAVVCMGHRRELYRRLALLLLAGGIVQGGLSLADLEWTQHRHGTTPMSQSISYKTLMQRSIATLGLDATRGEDEVLAAEDVYKQAVNVKSHRVFGHTPGVADEAYLQATMSGSIRWRLNWWQAIADEVTTADRWYRGVGFGVNLAEHHDIAYGEYESLRSPHNVHMTFLARAGYPGLALWFAVLAAWMLGIAYSWWRCMRSGQHLRAGVLVFLLAFGIAALVNATFDVYLEGPMGALWFWTIFGAGLAAAGSFGTPSRPACGTAKRIDC